MNNYRVVAFVLSLGVHTLFASAYYFLGQRGTYSSVASEGMRTIPSLTVGMVSTNEIHKKVQEENKENAGIKPKTLTQKKMFGPSSSAALKTQDVDSTNRIIPSPFNEMPQYNAEALSQGAEAHMICSLVLKADGCVGAVHIENCEKYSPILVRIVRKTLGNWRYTSSHTLENVTIRVPVNFSLDDV